VPRLGGNPVTTITERAYILARNAGLNPAVEGPRRSGTWQITLQAPGLTGAITVGAITGRIQSATITRHGREQEYRRLTDILSLMHTWQRTTAPGSN
jgi:hypothetical protein